MKKSCSKQSNTSKIAAKLNSATFKAQVDELDVDKLKMLIKRYLIPVG